MSKLVAHIAWAVLVTGLLLPLARPAEGQSFLSHNSAGWEQARIDLQAGLTLFEEGRTTDARTRLNAAIQHGHVLAIYDRNVALAARILVIGLAAQAGDAALQARLGQESALIAFGIGDIDQRLLDLAAFDLNQSHNAQPRVADSIGARQIDMRKLAAYLRQRISDVKGGNGAARALTLNDRTALFKSVRFLQGMASLRTGEEQFETLATAAALAEAGLGFGEQFTVEIVVRYFQSITASRILTDREYGWLSEFAHRSRLRNGPHNEMTQALRFFLLEHLKKAGQQDVLLELEAATLQLSIELIKFSRPFGSRDTEGRFRAGVVANAAHDVRRLALRASDLPERRLAEFGYRRGDLVEIAYRAAQLELVGPLTLASRAARLRREARKAGILYTHNWDSHMSLRSELWLELDETEGRPSDALRKTISDLKFHQLFADHNEAKFEAGVPHLYDLLKPETIGAGDANTPGLTIDADTALILVVSGPDDASGDTAIFVHTDKGLIHANLGWTASEFTSAIARFRNSILGTREPGELVAMRAPLAETSQPVASPVDLDLGFAIYSAMFSDPAVSNGLATKRNWVIAAKGSFLSLPFAALPTRPPKGGTQDAESLRKTSWLGLEKNLHFVGAPADAVRVPREGDASDSASRSGYIGFGDPLFSGPPRGLRASDYANLQDQTERLAAVASLPRLPATRQEVIETGALFTKENRIVRLGEGATEAELYAMSAVGSLRNLSVLHFATHGILEEGDALDIGAALALTPPATVTQIAPGIIGDGLLTISEIGLLQMDVDLVVLSACNTASGERNGGEALSGLVRVFLEAGAQSVVATHWAVEDAAAQRIVSSTLKGVAQDDSVAVSLRASLAKVVSDRSRDHASIPFSHPQVWAPFIAFSSR